MSNKVICDSHNRCIDRKQCEWAKPHNPQQWSGKCPRDSKIVPVDETTEIKGQSYIDELSGIVALPDNMSCSLMNFASRIKLKINEEQRKLAPDNALIALLADAARLGWEQIGYMSM